MAATSPAPARRARHRTRACGLPDAQPRDRRQPARLPRLRGQLAARARLDRGGRPLRAPPPLQRPPRLAHALGRGHRGLRGGAGDGRRPPRRGRPARARLHPQRDRGDQPGRPQLGRRERRRRATESCSPRWSTTPTSSPGSSSPSAPAPRSTGSESTTTAASCARTWKPPWRGSRSWSRSRTSPTSSARPTRSPRSPRPPTMPARWCSSTAPRRCRSCPSTSPTWASTSTPSPATRPTDRPGSARSGLASTCCARCRPSSAAAR